MSKIKHFAYGLAMTGAFVLVLFVIARRLPANLKALFQVA